MIPVAELRLNNWVIVDGRPTLLTVEGWKHYMFSNKYEFHPIPVTVEILEKYGFKLDGGKVSIYTLTLTELFGNRKYEMVADAISLKVCVMINREFVVGWWMYLHELQNAYYFFTRQELDYHP